MIIVMTSMLYMLKIREIIYLCVKNIIGDGLMNDS